MKKYFFALTLILILTSNISFSQFISQTGPDKLLLSEKRSSPLNITAPSQGPSGGFNLGVGSIEGNVAFAIGVFAEFRNKDFAFLPQANYWNAKDQSNFELAGLARFYLTRKDLAPYIDGGLGVNFYNSNVSDFTKLSILAGGGVELSNLGTSFSLVFDGKYKLIVNDGGNLSTFIFTAGMKFPFN